MEARIRDSLARLKDDRTHGAGWLTARALKVIHAAIRSSKAATVPALTREVKAVSAALLNARPGMVSISNCVLQFEEEYVKASLHNPSVASLKKAFALTYKKLIQNQAEASAGVILNAVKLIAVRSIIITCSFSASVCDTLIAAREGGLDFRVLAIESNSAGRAYGKMLASKLARHDVSCLVVPDGQIGWQIPRADMVLLGADAVSQQGWMLNGVPSLELCQWAAKRMMPVYAILETAKIDARGILTSMRHPPDGFDMLPLEMVTAFITERGRLEPDDIYSFSLNAFPEGKDAGTV